MSFNTPITVSGEIDPDGIAHPTTQTPLKIGSVYELSQILVEINSDGDLSQFECVHCGQELNEADLTETLADGDKECPATSDERHEAKTVPFTWAKNIAVSFDEDNDEIELAIATGEPRGGWTFKLRRTPEGGVIMHLPHADMSSPHEPIRELHPGTFAIG